MNQGSQTVNIQDLLLEIKRLFDQNKKARIVQIKTEEKIIAKIAQLQV
jgi:hypothetical protein